MTPDKTRDKFNYVGDATNLTHANLLFLVHKIICKNNQSLIEQGNIASFHIDPNNKSIDDSLFTPIDNFMKNEGQDKISIALCPGRLEKIDGHEQITGDTHWTGLHLRKITGDKGEASIKAYYMDSMWDKDNTRFDSFYKVPEPVKRVLTGLGIGGEVVKVKCNRQTDGYSCGYHAVHNLQAMHSLEIEGDKVIDLTILTNVDEFIKKERAFLKTKFNGDLDTKLMDARTKRGEGEKQGEKQGEKSKEGYESELLEIACSDTYNNLDKIKKIIQIEDEVNQIKESINRVTISSFLEFEKYYELFLRNFALNLQHKCSLTEELISEDEVVLNKRDNFFIKLTSDEVVKDPRKFLDILSTIDKNPKSIDTISEIKTDEELKDKINENKKLFFNLICNVEGEGEDEEKEKVTQFVTAVNKVFNDATTHAFKDRIDALVALSKLNSVPEGLEDSFNFLSKVDDKNFLPAIIPDYYQPKPNSQFRGWGLKAMFKGMDLTIEGKEVIQILDESGNDILAELKQTFKDDPKLFAYAVIDFFRRAEEDIDLVFNGHPNKKLSQSDKRTLEIKGDEVTDVTIYHPGSPIDTEKFLGERLKLYFNNSATKTPEVTPPKKDDKTPVPPPAGPSPVSPPAPQPLKPPRDRKYNLNLGANNIKRYGFLGEPDSGNESGKANANKFIIVDPAGTAFTGAGGDFDVDLVSGGSKALYQIFKKRPIMTVGEKKEGVKVNNKNEITIIKAGYAVYNNFSAQQSREFYGIIHAVGPENKEYVEQLKLLTQCLENVFIEYNEATHGITQDKPGLRIPAISSALYGIKDQSPEDYAKMFREALEKGFDDACKRSNKEIEFGKHGLEICMYSQKMHDAMSGEVTKTPSPSILPAGVRQMDPSKQKNRRGGRD